MAARERIAFIYENFANVQISFSGGKDSLVCLALALEHQRARGGKVFAVFRDEEFILPELCLVVEAVSMMEGVTVDWCLPKSEVFAFDGERFRVAGQWDGGERFRRVPDSARFCPVSFSQSENNDVYLRKNAGPLCLVSGARTTESLARRAAILSARGFLSNKKTFVLAKPIYDWRQGDVFKYIYSNKEFAPFVELYEKTYKIGGSLRASSLIQNTAQNDVLRLKNYDVTTFDRLMQAAPFLEFNTIFNKPKLSNNGFSNDLRGALLYAESLFEGEALKQTKRAIFNAFDHREKRNEADFPIWYIFRNIAAGAGRFGFFNIYTKKQRHWK